MYVKWLTCDGHTGSTRVKCLLVSIGHCSLFDPTSIQPTSVSSSHTVESMKVKYCLSQPPLQLGVIEFWPLRMSTCLLGDSGKAFTSITKGRDQSVWLRLLLPLIPALNLGMVPKLGQLSPNHEEKA